MTYEVRKWLDTGEVEFRIAAVSHRARVGNPLVRIGFGLLGRREQLKFYRHTCEVMAADRRRAAEYPRPMSARAWAGFFAMSTIWGVPYLFIKVAVDDGVPPAFLAWSRVVLGAAVLLLLAWRAGTLGSLRGRGRWLLAFAIFEIAVPFPLIAAGERHVDSSVAAIIIAAAPLIVAVLALRFDAASASPAAASSGLLIGLGGRRRARRDRHRRGDRRAARRGRDPRRGGGLRRRPDGPQPHARRRRPARDDGREPRDRGASLLTPFAAARPPAAAPSRRGDRARCSCSASSARRPRSSSTAA